MEREVVKVGELRFELVIPGDEEEVPMLEIENEASMLFESMDVSQAIQLRELLERYIVIMRDS